MRRKRKEPENIKLPSQALVDTFKDLPNALKDLLHPGFWLTFCCFISVICIYYWGTAVLFCLIPRAIWSIFFGG